MIIDHNLWLEATNLMDANMLSYHLEQIYFLQHERLIHLIVMALVAMLLMLSVVAGLFMPSFYLISVILFILTVFYIAHYFLLENTVQKWYLIYNKHRKMLDTIHNED